MENFIQTENEDGVVTINVRGAIDGITSPYLDSKQLFSQNPTSRVILNLSSVSFMDSAGVSAVVTLYKFVKSQNGVMVIVGTTGQPANLCDTLGLSKAIKFQDNVQQVKKYFSEL